MLDGTWLLVHSLRYMYVSVHYTLWFIDIFTVTRATPELTRLQLHRETPRTEVLLWRWEKTPSTKTRDSSPTFANRSKEL
jgi:hypothetical protein